MGREIVKDQRPAFPAVDAPVKPAVRRGNDSLLARGDPIHGGIRLRKRLPDALPARAAVIAPEQPVSSRGPESCRMPQVYGEGIDAGGGNSRSSARPASCAVDTRPDSALDDGVKGLRATLH